MAGGPTVGNPPNGDTERAWRLAKPRLNLEPGTRTTAPRHSVSGDLTCNALAATSPQRAHEAELVDAPEKAEAANHCKSTVLATVAHEIRNAAHGISK